MKILHNPRCSKSREALEVLRQLEGEPEVIEYLQSPLSLADLKALALLLQVPARDMIRTKEEIFSTLTLDLDDENAVLTAIATHPILLERPIVVRGNRAVIARPSDKIRLLFE